MSDVNPGLALINSRLQTIARLDELADEVDRINKDSKIALLSGTSASILGTVVGVPLSITAIVLTGGAAAVPIGIAAGVFGGLAGAGGVTSFGAGLGGHLHIKAKHQEAVAAVEADRVLGQQFLDCCRVSRGVLSVAGGVAFVVDKGAQIAGNVIRAGDATLDALEVVAKINRVAGGISIAVSTILLPLDIYILVQNSKDIHYERRHEKAEEIRGWARDLERTLPNLRRFVREVDAH